MPAEAVVDKAIADDMFYTAVRGYIMADKKSVDDANAKVAAEVARKKRTVRSFPASTFEEALSLASAILTFGSGKPVRRLSLFDHIQKAPESGPSRQLITNAGKYGIIKGGTQSEFLELTPDGRSAVDEETPPREKVRAQVKLAIEDVEPFKKLYDRFVGNKLPAKAALIDAAKEFEVAVDAADEAVDTFIVNLRFVGLLTTLSGADRIVTVEHLLDSLPSSTSVRPREASASYGIDTIARPMAIVTADHAHYDATCFYIAPIGADGSEQRRHSDLFLSAIVEPALEQFGLTIVRADGIDKPGIITKQIIEYIVKSRLVIVDLSFHNPNVFYELAIRHMMKLPIVQIARAIDSIPFDINQMRTIRIDNSDIYSFVPKMEAYRSEVSAQARRALDSAESVDTPINTYFPGLSVTLG